MQRYVEEFRRRGYEILSNAPTGIQSIIAFSPDGARAVKFSQDRAYDSFVRFVCEHPDVCFPVIYSHEEHGQDELTVGEPWCSVTEMERLSPLTETESQALVKWLAAVERSIKEQRSLKDLDSDPFGLLDALTRLLDHAGANQVGFDVLKASNFLVRASDGVRQFVVTDPYN